MTAPSKPDARLYLSRLVNNDDRAIEAEDAAKIAGSFLARLRIRLQEARQKQAKQDAPESSLERVR